MKKRVALLGSTGSIGANTLSVILNLGADDYEIVGLSADTNISLLARQARKFSPKIISVRDADLAAQAARLVSARVKVVYGTEGLCEIVSRPDVDIVVFAISGSGCLLPLIEAISRRKKIALANKESLVAGGSVVMALVKKTGASLIPVDSEHSAIFQCMEGNRPFIKKLYLTGSGGPLLDVPRKKFDSLSRAFVLTHPRWKMGKKISVDSATMMNKGLEIIEARWLFDIGADAIEVLVHPEAIIHSMVEFVDHSVIAQLGTPDMRTPIQYALTYPARERGAASEVDFPSIGALTFRKPDINKFPCLGLAREALRMGSTYPAVLNAANEWAVRAYLEGDIKFNRISVLIEKVMMSHRGKNESQITIGRILEAERWAKEEVRSLCYR